MSRQMLPRHHVMQPRGQERHTTGGHCSALTLTLTLTPSPGQGLEQLQLCMGLGDW